MCSARKYAPLASNTYLREMIHDHVSLLYQLDSDQKNYAENAIKSMVQINIVELADYASKHGLTVVRARNQVRVVRIAVPMTHTAQCGSQMLAVLLTEILSSPETLKPGISTPWIPSDGELAISCRSCVQQQPYAGESIMQCLNTPTVH